MGLVEKALRHAGDIGGGDGIQQGVVARVVVTAEDAVRTTGGDSGGCCDDASDTCAESDGLVAAPLTYSHS